MDELLKVLGLPPGSSIEDVRDAYKDLVKVWHPDRFANDPRLRAKAEQNLTEINNAYARLLLAFSSTKDGQSTHLTVQPQQGKPSGSTPLQNGGGKKLSELHAGRRRWLTFLGIACLIIGASIYLSKTRTASSLDPSSSVNTARTIDNHSQPSPDTGTTANGSPVNLEKYLDPVQTPTPKSTLTPKAQGDDADLFDPPSPSPTIPTYDEGSALRNGISETTLTPRPTPRATPRIERVVSANDVLSVGSGKREDSRRYRFQIDSIARIKGSFSATGGGVTVRILSGMDTKYVSGFNVSADSIDVALYPGVYELQVTLVGSDYEIVSFIVSASAYYNPE